MNVQARLLKKKRLLLQVLKKQRNIVKEFILGNE